uniref:Uracil DNA glycosylase n=1 Tax=Stegastes partitus TaxID=144197 RepID=A0A3B5A4M1_9TELE
MFAPRCRRFLNPASAHLLPALCFAQYTKIVQKKQKPCAGTPEPRSPSPSPLSPDQLDRIARNKRAALEKLAAAQTPPGFGESWRKGLSAEFGKAYFKQLMNFVSEERKRCTVFPPAEQVFTWTQVCDIRDVSSTTRCSVLVHKSHVKHLKLATCLRVLLEVVVFSANSGTKGVDRMH